MTKLRSDHNVLPLLGINKWEGEEGSCAYVKAYMIMNDLYVVRVRYSRTGSSWYMNRTVEGTEQVFGYDYYNCDDDLQGNTINHCVSEVIKFANDNDLIPEEYDYETDREKYFTPLSEEQKAVYRAAYLKEIDVVKATLKGSLIFDIQCI